jgi:hypothetical protein
VIAKDQTSALFKKESALKVLLIQNQTHIYIDPHTNTTEEFTQKRMDTTNLD